MDTQRLEKLDAIRERTGVNYTQADAALERAEGDVIKAIIDIEEGSNMKWQREEFWVKGNELVDKVKEVVRKGNVTRVIVKNEDGKTIVEIPMTVGVVGTVLAPTAAILGGIAALVTHCKIEIERPEESVHAYAFTEDPNNEIVN